MVIKQVDFIDIQNAAVNVGQYARLKRFFAFLDRRFNIKAAQQPVPGRAQRKIHHPRPALFGYELF